MLGTVQQRVRAVLSPLLCGWFLLLSSRVQIRLSLNKILYVYAAMPLTHSSRPLTSDNVTPNPHSKILRINQTAIESR